MPDMETSAVSRDYNSNRGTRKPLHDTTANNYSSPTPSRRYSKPQSSDCTQDMRPRRYNHAREQSYDENSQSKVVSSEAEYHSSRYAPSSTPTKITPAPKSSKLCRGKARVGPWILGRTLGKGSSGRVRLAKHFETGQLAAIKIVGKGQPESSSPRGNYDQGEMGSPLPSGLEREVVIMKLIDHPNVMGLWDVWENRGELYLVLEYIEGGELFDHLTSRGRLPEREAMRYFRQIMSGIDYCQHFNICHRDLKPENLLLDANNNIKIADFGMAALQPQGSLLNTPCGSPHYASPEIVSGKQYDGARSDIWSCGVVLFALLAGYLPFDHEDIRELLQKVMRGRFDMPQEFSNEAQDLIWRMLTVDPKARITIEQIWRHPLVKRHAPIDLRTGLEIDRGPRPPSSADIGRPVNNKVDVDREILKNLRTLWQGVREKELVERLLSNVHNQEKVFYYLLMKYRYEHLENYPGNEPVPSSSQCKPSDVSPTSYNKRQIATNTTYCHNQHRRQRSSLASRCDGHWQAEEKNGAIGPNSYVEDRRRFQGSYPNSQAGRSGARGGHVNGGDLQRQQPKAHLKAVASRSSLAVSARVGNRNYKRRSCHSRSSLVSCMNSSPSAYRSIKQSRSYKRHVSFKHQNSRHARSDGPKLTVRNNTDRRAWVDNGNREGINREHSPHFEQPEAALPPRSRKESASIVKRRSTVVIDGRVLHSAYAGTAQSLKKKPSFPGDHEDAERRRIVSKELEEACEKAFNSSAIRSSLATMSSVTSVGQTMGKSTNITSDSNFPHDIVCSSPGGRTHTVDQGLCADSQNGKENSLPADTLIRKRSDGRNTLRIFEDDENDPDKGYLDDVIEHLDRLMDSSAKFHNIGKFRAVSQGGAPLNLGGALLSAKDTPAPREYLDQEEGTDHQKRRVARADFRNVSTPNPYRNLAIDFCHPSKQLMPEDAALEPAPLNVRPKTIFGKSIDDIPRNETKNTIHAVNEALKFDAPILIPELKLPVAQSEIRNDGRVISNGNRSSKFVEGTESVTVSAAKEPRKKRSFMDILTGKKAAKSDKKKAKFGDEENLEFPDISTDPSVDVLAVGKGTFGKRSGNILRRLVSRDAKKELGIGSDIKEGIGLGNGSNTALTSILDGGNPLTFCFFPGGYTSDEEADTFTENHDEFTRVMSQRNWIQKVLNVKPTSRIIYFNISAFQCRKEILKLYKDWLKHGLVIVEDDRRGLVLRAKVESPNSLNIKEVTFVGEICTYSGTKKTGTSMVQFTQEKGAASSFNRVMDEIALICTLKGLIAQDQHN